MAARRFSRGDKRRAGGTGPRFRVAAKTAEGVATKTIEAASPYDAVVKAQTAFGGGALIVGVRKL
jgi:hypothetical protein